MNPLLRKASKLLFSAKQARLAGREASYPRGVSPNPATTARRVTESSCSIPLLCLPEQTRTSNASMHTGTRQPRLLTDYAIPQSHSVAFHRQNVIWRLIVGLRGNFPRGIFSRFAKCGSCLRLRSTYKGMVMPCFKTHDICDSFAAFAQPAPLP